MSDLTDYLKMLAAFPGLPKEDGYHSNNVAAFILNHGTNMADIMPVPKSRMGKIKECYSNATHLAISDPRYVYCEGYAIGIIPVPHAWCLVEHGHKWFVWDNTWREPGDEYYGVPITTDYLRHAVIKSKHYGCIDSWNTHWPMLKSDPDRWLHPVINQLRGALV